MASGSGSRSGLFARGDGQVHVAVGAPWREALAAAGSGLDARFWDWPAEVKRRDLLLTVLGTRPATLLCLERVWSSSSRQLVVDDQLSFEPLIAVSAVEDRAGVRLPRRPGTLPHGAADAVLEAVRAEMQDPTPLVAREGRCAKSVSRERSSGLQACALVAADGRCAGCERDFSRLLDGVGWSALEVHHLQHLADSKGQVETRVEDVAVVCGACHNMLHAPGRPSLADLRYGWRPACPACAGRQTRAVRFGYPAGPMAEDEVAGGCVLPAGEEPWWSCGVCGHMWGSRSPRDV